MRTLTPVKVWNACKVFLSYQWSVVFRKPRPWGLPFTISIEPTTACNLRCPECPSGLRAFTRDTGNLKMDFFRRVIDEHGKNLLYLIFYFQGEPFINPKFLDMVKHAATKGIYTITSTNGHFLDDSTARATVESGLARLIISIDGTTQETYQAYRRGGDLQQVLDGTRRIISWKKKLRSSTPYLIFQFLVVRPNEHQIDEVQTLARELGVDEVKLKTAQIYDYQNGNALIPHNTRYSRYLRNSDGTYRLKHSLTNSCWKLWHACVVTWDGKVVPCCFDKDAQHTMGDLKSDSLRDIWYADTYEVFRARLFAGRDQIDICTNCTEGCKVWA